MWGPVLLQDAGLTGQDSTDSLKPVNFTGCSSCTTASSQCSQPWHRSRLLLPTGLDPAHQGLGLLLMSTAWGSTHLQAGLLQPCFSYPWPGVRSSWAFSCCGSRSSPCCIQPPASEE